MSVYKKTTELKADARVSLLGHLTVSVCCILLYYISVLTLSALISVLYSENFILSLVFSAVTFVVLDTCSGLLEVGLDMVFLRWHYGKKAYVGDLFTAFRFNSNTCVSVRFKLALMDLACMLPALITAALPAGEGYTMVIAFYVLSGLGCIAIMYIRMIYALTPFMLLDFPQLTDSQILRAGRGMMKGHKARLFRLYLSFVPLIFVGILSFGIAGLWVESYLHASLAAFYKDRISNDM